MDFTTIFDAKFIFLCLVTASITFVLKHLLGEFKTNKWVKSVVLPSASIIVGGLVGLWLSTLASGLVAGLLSSLVYNRTRSLLQSKT